MTHREEQDMPIRNSQEGTAKIDYCQSGQVPGGTQKKGALRLVPKGAAAQDIEYHYDVGDDFYRLWLDSTMTYSSALWADTDSLELAQSQKNRFHLRESNAAGAARILDVGCGWGSLLTAAREVAPGAELVGLTLSRSQHAHCARQLPDADIRLEGWEDHVPEAPYDAIIAIGSLEHFVNHRMSSAERISRYTRFFEHCRRSLTPNGRLSLQTIGYGNLPGGKLDAFIYESIFPNSDLPFLEELVTACRDEMEIVSLKNHRQDYDKTCAEWTNRLLSKRDQAIELVGGPGLVDKYIRYLKMSAAGFRSGALHLYRMTLRPYR